MVFPSIKRHLKRHLRIVCFTLHAALSACGPDLNVSPGDPGNLTGMWVGTFTREDDPTPFVLWLEQDGETLAGVADFPRDPPEKIEPADEEMPCNMKNGKFANEIVSFALSTERDIDILIEFAFDSQTEKLDGAWAADTSMVDEGGQVELTRVSWLPTRVVRYDDSTTVETFLGCIERPAHQCFDGLDNDGDGLTDADDPACCMDASYYDCLLIGNDEDADPPCNDGLDNDADGLVDAEDAECSSLMYSELGNEPACADGWDNDRDGLADLEDPDCNADSSHSRETAPMCSDGLDNDGDGMTDEDDPECGSGWSEDTSLPGCSNGYDDDDDGLVDLDDPSCHGDPLRQQEYSFGQCDDGLDNDGDGLVDLEEPDCSAYFITNENGELSGETSDCADGEDNDGDTLADRSDPDCREMISGWEIVPDMLSYQLFSYCFNDVDDDGDGLVDEDDPGCSVGLPGISLTFDDPFIGYFESVPPCLDGLDNDEDGLVDLNDPDCVYPFAFWETPRCSNGHDDDGDGLADIEDPGCFGDPDAEEVHAQCSDGVDNDGDGFIDGEDPHCASDADSKEASACTNLEDNDGDGYIDGADQECTGPDDDLEVE